MEFADLVRRRRMTRAFADRAVDSGLLDRVLDRARRVPSAGNSQGVDFVVLEGPEQTRRYWDVTMPPQRRDGFRWQRLFAAPVVITIWADPARYVERYGEHDKERTGLGADAASWATPYWLVDASFAAMALQYAAIDEGLGVLFFGMFDHADAVAAALGVPADKVPVGTVALGWPDASLDEPGRSTNRARRPLAEVVHRGGW
jgi:nitroreductase